jgi:hypothetical protein
MITIGITIQPNRNTPRPATVTITIAQKVNIKTQKVNIKTQKVNIKVIIKTPVKLASPGTPIRSGCLRRKMSTACQRKLTTPTTSWIRQSLATVTIIHSQVDPKIPTLG